MGESHHLSPKIYLIGVHQDPLKSGLYLRTVEFTKLILGRVIGLGGGFVKLGLDL